MSSLLPDIPAWVAQAPAGEREFRQAVHVLLHAVATSPQLSRSLCMKGGILMALHYRSERYTSDIDFSTPDPFTIEAEEEFRDALERALAIAPETLGHDLDCRVQSFKVDPGHDKTFVTLRLKVAYARPSTPAHKRLAAGQGAQVLGLDYSFNESIPDQEFVEIDDTGTLRVYGLGTLVAEKLRALLQQVVRGRNRRQDIYDLDFLLRTQPQMQSPSFKARLLGGLVIKCRERGVDPAPDTFDDPKVRAHAEADYSSLVQELPEGKLPSFEESFDAVAAFYRSLPWDFS